MLVVEDSEADYDLLRYLFRIPGFKLETQRVEDERGMREALIAEPWDVVVSDHNLPQFSSKEAIRTLALSGVDIPLIILSGVIGEEAAVEAMLSGADDFVMKANPRRLIPAIERSRSVGRAAAPRVKSSA